MDVRGKVVLITGSSDGIGAACAAAFRKRGALLALTGRSEEKLRAVARGGDLAIPADLAIPESPQRIVTAVLGRFGRIDVLVNNAGVGMYVPSWRAPEDQTRALFEVNFFAPLRLAQLAAASMRERRSGVIVNVSSIAGQVTLPWFTLYSATKFALCSLSDGLRMELAGDGIHVVAVCPGYVNTGFQSHIIGGKVPDRLVSARRFTITAEQCAEAIVRGVERERRTVVAPGSGWALIALARLFPGLVDVQLKRFLDRDSQHVTAR